MEALELLENDVENYLLGLHDGYVYYTIDVHRAEPSDTFPDHSYVSIHYNDRTAFDYFCGKVQDNVACGDDSIELKITDISHSDMIIQVEGSLVFKV